MIKVSFTIVLIICSLCILFGSDGGQPKINMLIFLSEKCEICDDFQTKILPDLESTYHLEYTIYYDFNDDSKALLNEIESEFGKLDAYPIILIGTQLISGEEVYSEFESLLKEYTGLGGCCVPLLFDFQEKQESSEKFPVHIAYIYSTVNEEFNKTDNDLEKLKEIYPSLEIRKFNIETTKGKQMNDALGRYYDTPKKNLSETPKMFIGDEILLETQLNIDTMKMLIRKYQEYEDIAPWIKILDKNQGE